MAKPPRSSIPSALQPIAYWAIRAAAAAATVGPLGPTVNAAEALGHAWGRARINRKRLRRAEENLRIAFPDWPEERIHECAVRSYGHILRLGAELIGAPRRLTEDGWTQHVATAEIAPSVRALIESGPCVLITGHCGNWEILAYTMALLGFPIHALYRPLDLKPLDRWVHQTRQRRGLTLVDKFGAVRQLPRLVAGGAPAGFVADQNGGDRGVFVPFFGRLTSTYKSIALLALQFDATIICGACRRLTPAERRARNMPPDSLGYIMELDDIFGPADWATHPDPLFYVSARYRRSIQRMVERAPEQYLWMHRIWRSRPRHERLGRPFPAPLLEKLRLLPWLTESDIARLIEHSERDAATLAATGQTRLS